MSERDIKRHGTMRKNIAHGFSQRSLIEQEILISGTVDRFIEKVGSSGDEGVDIMLLYTLMSFDIIGDLAFGESFRGLDAGEEQHCQHTLSWIRDSDTVS